MRKWLLILILVMMGTAHAATNLKVTDLYESPEEWCTGLHVVVSGQDISSDDYYLVDCGESTTANTWYCNCETDEEFDITFVNTKTDLKTYIIDIKSGTSSVRRIVSQNKLSSTNTQSVTTNQTRTYENRLWEIEKVVAAHTIKIDGFQGKEEEGNTTQQIRDAVNITATYQFNNHSHELTPAYDDTEVKGSIQVIQNRRALSGIFIVVIFIVFSLVMAKVYLDNEKIKKYLEGEK